MSVTAPSPDAVQFLQKENGTLREENTVLRAQIAWLKQKLFGSGQSEKLATAAERRSATVSYERPLGPAPKRTLPAETFAHLPVKETVVIEPPAVQAEPTLYEKIGDARAGLRQEHFARPLAELKALAQAWLDGPVLPRSEFGQACTYLLGHWTPLTAHLQYSQTKLDTNAIRPSALGKKNWLFIGHPDAGERTAVMYSLLGSCARYGHQPHDYLKDVLSRLPTMTNQDDLRPLLPSQWKAASPVVASAGGAAAAV